MFLNVGDLSPLLWTVRTEPNRDYIQVGGSCCPPWWQVLPHHLDSRSDLRLVGQVVCVIKRVGHTDQLPKLELVSLGQPRVEVADGGAKLAGAHGSTHPLPRTSSRACFSDMPSRMSLRICCSCWSAALSPGSRPEEGGSTEILEELKLF